MKKLDEVANPQSCLNRAQDNEPLFVLRAHDPIAPIVVRAWVHAYNQHKALTQQQLTPPQSAKVQEALDLAHEMEQWYVNFNTVNTSI